MFFEPNPRGANFQDFQISSQRRTNPQIQIQAQLTILVVDRTELETAMRQSEAEAAVQERLGGVPQMDNAAIGPPRKIGKILAIF